MAPEEVPWHRIDDFTPAQDRKRLAEKDFAAERANRNVDNSGYDPATYLEADLFGEEDTRSSMMRLVSQRLTKIINIPNMKDHGATGVTGCLKNLAYGSFSNVARTHQNGSPRLAKDFLPARIDHAAMPIRVEKWHLDGKLKYRVVGLLWGGSESIQALAIQALAVFLERRLISRLEFTA